MRLVPDNIVQDPRLADLAVTQTLIDDGWIGISIGPEGPQAREARR